MEMGEQLHGRIDRIWRDPTSPETRFMIERWKAGKTGVPFVDAAMRQLLQTGWMHNRARMVVASYLTKNMRVDWREGEKHFATHLVDYDPAANNGGWQWAASTGADAQPYFRVFNPWTQGLRYDKEAVYIKKYIKELKDVESKDIHNWFFSEVRNKYANNQLVCLYPEPMIDTTETRKDTIAAWKQL